MAKFFVGVRLDITSEFATEFNEKSSAKLRLLKLRLNHKFWDTLRDGKLDETEKNMKLYRRDIPEDLDPFVSSRSYWVAIKSKYEERYEN